VAEKAVKLIGSACAYPIMARSALRSSEEVEDTTAVPTPPGPSRSIRPWWIATVLVRVKAHRPPSAVRSAQP